MHPRVFAALGADLITNDIVAIVELVKNSYDAMATRVDVRFHSDGEEELIEVQDNGEGMSRSIIESVWCVVATPYRTIEPLRKEGKRKRRVSGEKGLGRLSTARLGKKLDVLTRPSGEPCWHLEMDWTTIAAATSMNACSVSIRECETDPLNKETGTLVRVKRLNSEWPPVRIGEVAEQLSRLISPFAAIEDFSIWLTSPAAESRPIEIEPPDFLSQPPYLLTGTVDAAGNLKSQYSYSTAQPIRLNPLLIIN